MLRDMNCLLIIEHSSAKENLRGKNRLLIDNQNQRLSNKKTLKKQTEAVRNARAQVTIEAVTEPNQEPNQVHHLIETRETRETSTLTEMTVRVVNTSITRNLDKTKTVADFLYNECCFQNFLLLFKANDIKHLIILGKDNNRVLS